MMRYLKVVFANIIILIIPIILLTDNVVFTMEKPFITLNLKLRGGIDNDKKVYIVNIDEKSIQTYGKWPWGREKIAKLVDAIAQYKPKVIGIEILFIEKSDNDVTLNSVIKKSGNIVIAYARSSNLFPFNYEEPYDKKDYEFGFVDKVYDKSGEVLGINPMIRIDGKIHKAFAVAIAEKYENKLIDDINNLDLLRANFYGPNNTFRHYSAIDLLDHVVRDSFERNIVVVSANIMPFLDNTAYGAMPTTEIHANIIQNIIDKNWLRFNKVVNYIVFVVTGFIFYITLVYKKWWLGLLIVTMLYFGFSQSLIFNGMIISATCLIAVMIFNYFLYTAWKVT